MRRKYKITIKVESVDQEYSKKSSVNMAVTRESAESSLIFEIFAFRCYIY